MTGRPSATRTATRLFAEFTGFAVLLFLTRFVARGYGVPQMDQECHIGGIAVDVLAHGIRFPLLAYAPNEYDNGSFFSGLLAALSFAVLGRNVLALKLVTHLISAAGAVATLWLLRACLDELGLTSRRARWAAIGTLIVAIALAPTVVTALSMYAVGNHPEGAAIDVILLAVFSRRPHTRSPARSAAFWALVGLALYVNKGTALVIPVLGAAEIALAWPERRRLAAALGGFVLGTVPELLVIVQRHGMGWATMASKAERTSPAFPRAFLEDILTLGEYRIALLAAWTVALTAGTLLLVRSWQVYRGDRQGRAAAAGSAPFPSVALGLAVGVTWLYLAALTVMAQGGFDAYVIYGFPILVVLYSVLVAWTCAQVASRWGEGADRWAGAAAIGLTVVLYRPTVVQWRFDAVARLWRDRSAAACSWRFAEGFEREQQYGLAPPGRTREQHAIDRCRSLSEPAQVLDCIGGVARELHWRRNGHVDGEPPAELSAAERQAYAYYYGTHRKGDLTACNDFTSPDLKASCVGAVTLDCLVFADQLSRGTHAQGLGRPRCEIRAPPMDSYWAAMRSQLLARAEGPAPSLARADGEGEIRACQPVFDECY